MKSKLSEKRDSVFNERRDSALNEKTGQCNK